LTTWNTMGKEMAMGNRTRRIQPDVRQYE